MRLAIIEENQSVLETLRHVLGGEERITLVGAYGSAEAAFSDLKRTAPDILLLGLCSPHATVGDLIRQVKEGAPGMEVMLYSALDDRETIHSAFRAGATGYLLRGTRPVRLIAALEELHAGGAPMSPKVARTMVLGFRENAAVERELLSGREREILAGMARGLTYRELAGALQISPYTVRTHIKNIYGKLPARNRVEALRQARKCGLI